jgi:hypothetical protein
MSNNSQTNSIESTEPQGAAIEPVESNLGCVVQLLVTTVYNGHSYIAGTIIGNVPLAVARKMESFRTAKIVGVPTPFDSHRARDLNAIENRIPAALGLDPSQWQPACPIPGQASSVFINSVELEALQNGR